MDSGKIIIDSNMTISELSLLFLEGKYNKISFNAYGSYQDRLKIINEYLGKTKLKDFNKSKIDDFEDYLFNRKKWNYTAEPSEVTVKEIMSTLYLMLKDAIKWKLLDNDYNCIIEEKVGEGERANLTELQKLINDNQKKMVANSLDKIWKKEEVKPESENENEYDTILSLAKKNNFKKIMIMRDSWSVGNWCIVNIINIKPDGKYCYAFGHIKYSNGNTFNGRLPAENTYSWKLIKVLDEDMKVNYMEKKK